MELVAEIVFWLAAAAVSYTYVGYAAFMALLAWSRPRPIRREDIEPELTVIVTAYNEERGIAAKIENLLGTDYPKARLQLIVGSDASTDQTDAIVSTYADRGVELLRVEGRGGKTEVQNRCVASARGRILVFTDATTVLRADALRKIVRPFADPTVGCVGGRLIYVNTSATQVGQGGTSYWSYERTLKQWESRANSLIGVSGCFYAVRRAAYRPIEPDMISDFVIALDTVVGGSRVIYEPEAISEEETLRDAADELRMRIRVALRTYRALYRRRGLLNPLRHGLFAIQLLSHKVMRYAVGVFLIAMLASSALKLASPLYAVMFVGQSAFYAAALAGHLAYRRRNAKGLFSLPYYFVLANVAALIALGRALRGESVTTWEPRR